jgi:hypothetical protein
MPIKEIMTQTEFEHGVWYPIDKMPTREDSGRAIYADIWYRVYNPKIRGYEEDRYPNKTVCKNENGHWKIECENDKFEPVYFMIVKPPKGL